MRIAVDHLHNLLSSRWSAVAAAAVDAERAVVVHEEHRLLALLVDQAEPHDAAAREELLRLVHGNDLVALAHELPGRRFEGRRKGVRALHRGVVCAQAALDHDFGDVLALLQAHDIRHSSLDDGGGTAVVALPLAIQAPPLQVVSQGLHLQGGSRKCTVAAGGALAAAGGAAAGRAAVAAAGAALLGRGLSRSSRWLGRGRGELLLELRGIDGFGLRKHVGLSGSRLRHDGGLDGASRGLFGHGAAHRCEVAGGERGSSDGEEIS
mmetsp:Transcript_72099/g.190121  ORF Transcript_72099/g.190121 Transcript_72099/m.190121 type:complete len:265 (+) Transcript_72099:411-1205(+)